MHICAVNGYSPEVRTPLITIRENNRCPFIRGARTISGGRLSDRGRSRDCGRIVNCLPGRPVQIYAGRTLGSCGVAHLSTLQCVLYPVCTVYCRVVLCTMCSVMMTHLKRRELVWTLVNRRPAVSRPICPSRSITSPLI